MLVIELIEIYTAQHWSEYKKLRNQVTSKLRSLKAGYLVNLAKDKSSRQFWSEIRHLKSKHQSPCQGTDVSADNLNQYFYL